MDLITTLTISERLANIQFQANSWCWSKERLLLEIGKLKIDLEAEAEKAEAEFIRENAVEICAAINAA